MPIFYGTINFGLAVGEMRLFKADLNAKKLD